MKKIILGVAFLGFFGFLCGGEAGAASFGANAFDLNQAAATLELGQNRPQYLAQVDTELRGDATDFTFFLQKIIKILVTFAGAVAVILLIINGLILVTAAGEEDRINTAKKGLTWAGAGLVLITFAYLIAKTAIWVTFIAEIGEEKICKDPVPYPCYDDKGQTTAACDGDTPWGVNPSPATCNAATGNDECTTRSLQEALWEEGMYHKDTGQDYTESQAVDGQYGRKSQKALFELKETLGCRDSICDEEIPNSCFNENGELTLDSAAHCYIKKNDWDDYFEIVENGNVNHFICRKFEIGNKTTERGPNRIEYDYYDCDFDDLNKKYDDQKTEIAITPWKDSKIPQPICDSVFWKWSWSGDKPAESPDKAPECTLENLQKHLIYNITSCQSNNETPSRKYDHCTQSALSNWQNLQCKGEVAAHPICEMEIIKQCGKKGDPRCKSFYKYGKETDRIPNEWVDDNSTQNIPEKICALVGLPSGCTIRELQVELGFTGKDVDGIYGGDTYKALDEMQKKECGG